MAQMVQCEDSVQVHEGCFSVTGQLKSHDRAFDIKTWRNAISDEVKMIDTNTTWKLVEKLEKKSSNNWKWIYYIKRDAYGNSIKYKARRIKGLKQNTKSLELDRNTIKRKCWL